MTGIATMNVGKSLVSKIALTAGLFWQLGATVLCLQEVDVNSASAPGTVSSFRRHGLFLLLGGFDGFCYRTAILSSTQGRPVQLQGVQDASRVATAIFEFVSSRGVRKVLISSCYGDACDALKATDHAFQVAGASAAVGMEWMMLGDFNVSQDERPVAARLAAAGCIRCLDDFFLCGGPLPMTSPARSRRIDYGWASCDLAPVAVSHEDGVADHAAVMYGFDLSLPAALCGPSRLPAGGVDNLVPAWHWDARWRPVASSFAAALEQADVNLAWQVLSMAAEEVLCTDAPIDGAILRRAVPRHATWQPRRPRDLHKAAHTHESLLLTRLRRLLRRAAHLCRVPGDVDLREKIGRDLSQLGDPCPVLLTCTSLEAQDLCPVVEELIAAVVQQEKQGAIDSWRRRICGDLKAQRAWIRRRSAIEVELEQPAPEASVAATRAAIHPSGVLEKAEKDWLPRWQPTTSISTTAVQQVFEAVPIRQLWTQSFSFSGPALRSIARGMVGKAAGPDDWQVEQWLRLPDSFWGAFGELWSVILEHGAIPDMWRYARVALIDKPCSGHRPLSILCIGWRIGAKCLLGQLERWTDSFLDHRLLGGVKGRCAKDALAQLRYAAAERQVIVGQDLEKFFDSIRVQSLDIALERLGAPRALRSLIDSFYGRHFRLFSYAGFLGSQWHQVSAGIAQGCPLSPLMAAVVMAGWTERLAAAQVQPLVFVDDRYFFGCDQNKLLEARALSDDFDRAMGFVCDRGKCQVAHWEDSVVGPELAACWDYAHGTSLKTLGVRIDMHGECQASLLKFTLDLAKRRLRLIGVVADWLWQRRVHIASLATPLFSWAGAYAMVSLAEAKELRKAVVGLGAKGALQDRPPVLVLEQLGWKADPVFMRRWAALTEAVRLHGDARPWQDTAPLAVASQKWTRSVPAAVLVLRELGWWHEQEGNAICRWDVGGIQRSFRLNLDSDHVLFEWLADWHRRAELRRCGRVARSYHRTDSAHCGRGRALPGVARDALCLFRGHLAAYRHGDLIQRQLALATGCSGWHKAKKLGLDAPPRCLCGLHDPSRPHLLWECEATRHLWAPGLSATNRVEERLLAKVVPETPAAPVVIDVEDFLLDLVRDLELAFEGKSDILVATDGSEVTNVAACAISVEGQGVHSIGIDGEDQSPYKAEVQALLHLVAALLRVRARGRVVAAVDCTAAIQAAEGRGQLRVLCHSLASGIARLNDGGLDLELHWVPSHGKSLPRHWTPPQGFAEPLLRRLNELADRAAREAATLRARGSRRQMCCSIRLAAERWEAAVLMRAATVAAFFDLYG